MQKQEKLMSGQQFFTEVRFIQNNKAIISDGNV